MGNIRKALVAMAIAGLMVVQVVGNSAATTTTSASEPAFADADIIAEGRILGEALVAFRRLDTSSYDLLKKERLTRSEFVAFERQGEDLKRQVAALQNTLRQAVDKLKASGQWGNLDETILARNSDSGFRTFVRAEGFKKTLEEAASGRNINVNEIVGPLDVLRNKVQGQLNESTFERGNSPLASRAVRVSYTTAPAMIAAGIRCRLARIRQGFSGFVSKDGKSSTGANVAANCFCGDVGGACDIRFSVD